MIDFVTLDFEELDAGLQRLADEELEGAVGGFEIVALVFGLFDAFDAVRGGPRRSSRSARVRARAACRSTLLRPERSLTSTRWRLPTSSGEMCS